MKKKKLKSQSNSAAAARERIEPLRVASAVMLGSKISARTNDDRTWFEYTMAGAQVVNGRLKFEGTITPASKAGVINKVIATLVGTLAIPDNSGDRGPTLTPRNSSTQSQASGAEAPSITAQPVLAPAQSVASATEAIPATGRQTDGSGVRCQVMFLKIRLPHVVDARSASQPVQVGVVLDPIDNPLGEKINQCVCHITRVLATGSGEAGLRTGLAELNQLLSTRASIRSS